MSWLSGTLNSDPSSSAPLVWMAVARLMKSGPQDNRAAKYVVGNSHFELAVRRFHDHGFVFEVVADENDPEAAGFLV